MFPLTVPTSTLTYGFTSMLLIRTTNQLVLGSRDGHISMFDLATNQSIEISKEHEGAITDLAYSAIQDLLCSSAQDGTIRVWEFDHATRIFVARRELACHTTVTTSLSLHPSGSYLACSSVDGTWSLLDVRTTRLLLQRSDDDSAASISGSRILRFHPDGLILAVGTPDHRIHLWDLKSQSRAASLDGHVGPVQALAFSENGYHLASSSEGESCVRLWDLRKLTNFHTIHLARDAGDRPILGSALAFDDSGQFLAVGTSNGTVRIYRIKSWEELVVLANHGDAVTSVCFGPDARTLYTSSMDGAVFAYSI
jgi:pre-mRNA-processing factor 19